MKLTEQIRVVENIIEELKGKKIEESFFLINAGLLEKKSKLRKEFIFKTIKSCYGKGNWIGGQGKVLKNNLLLLEEITSKYLN